VRVGAMRPAPLCRPAGTRSLGAPARRLASRGGATRADPVRKRSAAGMGPASSAESRGRTGRDGAPRRRGAWSSCLRINWPNSQPRPVVAHGQRGPAPGVACETAAAAASAAEEGRVQGRRGRRPRPGRDHAVRSRSGAATRRPRRARRRRPAPAAPSPMEAGDRRLGRALGQHGRGEGGGRGTRRPCVLQPVRMRRFSRPIRNTTAPWTPAGAGASTGR
jgi:hypothetical protein